MKANMKLQGIEEALKLNGTAPVTVQREPTTGELRGGKMWGHQNMGKYRYWVLLDCSSVGTTSGLGNKATESGVNRWKNKGTWG